MPYLSLSCAQLLATVVVLFWVSKRPLLRCVSLLDGIRSSTSANQPWNRHVLAAAHLFFPMWQSLKFMVKFHFIRESNDFRGGTPLPDSPCVCYLTRGLNQGIVLGLLSLHKHAASPSSCITFSPNMAEQQTSWELPQLETCLNSSLFTVLYVIQTWQLRQHERSQDRDLRRAVQLTSNFWTSNWSFSMFWPISVSRGSTLVGSPIWGFLMYTSFILVRASLERAHYLCQYSPLSLSCWILPGSIQKWSYYENLWIKSKKKNLPLVHFFLNVLIQFIYLALQLLPPLFWWQVAEVFWPRALETPENGQRKWEKRGKENGKQMKKRHDERSNVNDSLVRSALCGVFSS